MVELLLGTPWMVKCRDERGRLVCVCKLAGEEQHKAQHAQRVEVRQTAMQTVDQEEPKGSDQSVRLELPPALLEAASWACPQLGPFVRQAVGVAVRRGLAHAVNATHVHVPPPPPPAAPVAVRPRLTPWMDAARAGGVVVRELQ